MLDPPLRIVDFSTHVSGPMASHLLTEFGAEVIKIERPGLGDGTRGIDEGLFHTMLNAGTRSLSISTRDPHWTSVVQACSRWADAVIVGTRPSAARQRGLDFASLHAANPKLVYCLISGYGTQGRWRGFSAHGQNVDSFAGLASCEWRDGLPVTPEGWRSTGTTLAGVFAAMGILAGILKRDRSGASQHVSVSLWGSAMWWNWRDLNSLANVGAPWREYRSLGSRYAMYPTSDDRVVLVAPIEPKFWKQFCEIMGLPKDWQDRGDWAETGTDFGTGERGAAEVTAITERMRQGTLQEWLERFSDSDVPFAPLLTAEEALNSEHARSEGVMRETMVGDRAFRITATPVRFETDQTVGVQGREGELTPLPSSPTLGEHNDEVLKMLGLDDLRASFKDAGDV